MSDRIFGTDHPSPPYRFIGTTSEGCIEIERVKQNWQQTIVKNEHQENYDKNNYYICIKGAEIWYHREKN